MVESNVEQICGFYIVVLDRGFVYVGDACRKADGLLVIKDSRNIRRWGANLCCLVNGPVDATEYEFAGEVIAPWHAVMHFIKADKSKWVK